jgi:hypothetical protein
MLVVRIRKWRKLSSTLESRNVSEKRTLSSIGHPCCSLTVRCKPSRYSLSLDRRSWHSWILHHLHKMAFSGRPYVNVGSKICRGAYSQCRGMHGKYSGRSYPSFTLPRHLRKRLRSGYEFRHGIRLAPPEQVTIRARRPWFLMPRSEKPFSGIMSARHTLFDLPPERQYSDNHSSVRIRANDGTWRHFS